MSSVGQTQKIEKNPQKLPRNVAKMAPKPDNNPKTIRNDPIYPKSATWFKTVLKMARETPLKSHADLRKSV